MKQSNVNEESISQTERMKNAYMISNHVEAYAPRNKRSSLEGLYPSERHTLQLLFGKFNSVLDVGCNVGNVSKIIFDNCDKSVKYIGVDLDPRAIKEGKKLNPKAEFILGNVLEDNNIPKADLVIAFNVIDQYEDWKRILKAVCDHSNKYVNFSTLLRLEGETVLDEDISYTYYSGQVLWAVHNVFSLISYCGSKHINASKIYVYCYNKPLENSMHPMHPKDLYVGNIILEIDKDKAWINSKKVPEVQIVISGNTYYSNTKKSLF